MSALSEKICKVFAPGFQEYGELDALQKSYRDLLPFLENDIAGLRNYDEAFLVRFVYNTNAPSLC
jgi:hypothetical protein